MLTIRTSTLSHNVPGFTFRYSTLATPRIPKSIARSKTTNFVISCNSQITKNGRNGNLSEAEFIFTRMPIKTVVSWTAMLTAYAENGFIAKARKLFDEMPQRNSATWNAMITAYTRNGLYIWEARQLFWQMPVRNSVSHAVMITGFLRAGMLHEAEKLYAEMPVLGRDPVASNVLINGYLKMGKLDEAIRVFESMVERDVVSWSSILDGYCKYGRISEARNFFGQMPERNVVSFTAMLDGYFKNERWDDGFGLFLQMRREHSVEVNSTTMTVVFEACSNMSKYREGVQVHGLVLCMGFEFDVFLGNSIITMYCRAGSMDAANKIFDMINMKDIVSWNSLIAGYVQNDGIEEAYKLFRRMPRRDIVSWTSMIAGFSSKGRMGESISLFNDMPNKDDIAWTAIISGLASNQEYELALCWYIRMMREAVRPNALTLSSVLGASAGLATLNQGDQVHSHVVKLGMESDTSVQNSLLSMHAKCGDVSTAYGIFASISSPNVVSLNSMITAFAQHGFGEEAIDLFGKMLSGGHKPNEITFLGVLSACAHVGFIQDGCEYFKTMSSIYHIEPGPDHYACMVDLLGRAGLLKEALDLIDAMPCKPHQGVWGALLSASRKHMDLDFAKLAATHLFKLEPDNATPYVVLSNIYSTMGMKKDEEELRKAKKAKRAKKNPGCSWITVGNKVHSFLAGDQSHIEYEEISGTLRRISKELRDSCFHN